MKNASSDEMDDWLLFVDDRCVSNKSFLHVANIYSRSIKCISRLITHNVGHGGQFIRHIRCIQRLFLVTLDPHFLIRALNMKL